MKLLLNGEETVTNGACTVAELLHELSVRRERVAVEVNGEVVRRADHDRHTLRPGDRVEIVGFVGGG